MRTLIVVDMQNDFIDGALGTKEAQAIVPAVRKKIDGYLAAGDRVIFTRDTHGEDYLSTHEGKLLPVPHCIKGTLGWQIEKTLDREGCIHVDKGQFGYLDWLDFDLENVEIIGLCTDICVISNALIIRAQYPEIDIKVDSACCAGVTPDTHEAALLAMKTCQIEVL